MAPHRDRHDNRNLTLAEHVGELLIKSFPRLGKDTETIIRTLQALAPYAQLFLKWVKEQPHINRKSLIKLAKIGWFPDLGMPLDNLLPVMQAANEDPIKAETIAIDFLRARVDAIESELAQSYPNRSHLFCDAFEAHRKRKYNLSIPVLLAQCDGIFWEASTKILFRKEDRENCCLGIYQKSGPRRIHGGDVDASHNLGASLDKPT